MKRCGTQIPLTYAPPVVADRIGEVEKNLRQMLDMQVAPFFTDGQRVYGLASDSALRRSVKRVGVLFVAYLHDEVAVIYTTGD